MTKKPDKQPPAAPTNRPAGFLPERVLRKLRERQRNEKPETQSAEILAD